MILPPVTKVSQREGEGPERQRIIHSAAFSGNAAQLSIAFLKERGRANDHDGGRSRPPSLPVPGPLVQPWKEESLARSQENPKKRAYSVQRPGGRASMVSLMPGLAEFRVA